MRHEIPCYTYSIAFLALLSALSLKKATSLSVCSRRTLLQSTAAVALGANLEPAFALETDDLKIGGSIQYGDDSIMSPKAHGTSEQPVQANLLYGVNNELADRITIYNRRYAEAAGYFTRTNFKSVMLQSSQQTITFYDPPPPPPHTGKPLFVPPIGRLPEQFLRESELHGWPSFRDEEVVWANVRVLRG